MDAKYRLFKSNGQTVVDLVSLVMVAVGRFRATRAHVTIGIRPGELVTGLLFLCEFLSKSRLIGFS